MKRLRGAPVVVTGASGFVGSHLARRLSSAGARVHVFARKTSSLERLASLGSKLSVHVGDLEDDSSLRACLKVARPRLLFHLARERSSSFQSDVRSALRIAAALRSAAPRLERWIRTAPPSLGAYGAGADARVAASLMESGGPATVTLHLHQVYGPGQDPSHFPMSLLHALRRGGPLRASASGVKDFVHVDDVVEAYLLAALSDGATGRTVPIGTGVGMSEFEAAQEILKAARVDVRRLERGTSGERGGHAADARLARDVLGWVPRVDFSEGARRLVRG